MPESLEALAWADMRWENVHFVCKMGEVACLIRTAERFTIDEKDTCAAILPGQWRVNLYTEWSSIHGTTWWLDIWLTTPGLEPIFTSRASISEAEWQALFLEAKVANARLLGQEVA